MFYRKIMKKYVNIFEIQKKNHEKKLQNNKTKQQTVKLHLRNTCFIVVFINKVFIQKRDKTNN